MDAIKNNVKQQVSNSLMEKGQKALQGKIDNFLKGGDIELAKSHEAMIQASENAYAKGATRQKIINSMQRDGIMDAGFPSNFGCQNEKAKYQLDLGLCMMLVNKITGEDVEKIKNSVKKISALTSQIQKMSDTLQWTEQDIADMVKLQKDRNQAYQAFARIFTANLENIKKQNSAMSIPCDLLNDKIDCIVEFTKSEIKENTTIPSSIDTLFVIMNIRCLDKQGSNDFYNTMQQNVAGCVFGDPNSIKSVVSQLGIGLGTLLVHACKLQKSGWFSSRVVMDPDLGWILSKVLLLDVKNIFDFHGKVEGSSMSYNQAGQKIVEAYTKRVMPESTDINQSKANRNSQQIALFGGIRIKRWCGFLLYSKHSGVFGHFHEQVTKKTPFSFDCYQGKYGHHDINQKDILKKLLDDSMKKNNEFINKLPIQSHRSCVSNFAVGWNGFVENQLIQTAIGKKNTNFVVIIKKIYSEKYEKYTKTAEAIKQHKMQRIMQALEQTCTMIEGDQNLTAKETIIAVQNIFQTLQHDAAFAMFYNKQLKDQAKFNFNSLSDDEKKIIKQLMLEYQRDFQQYKNLLNHDLSIVEKAKIVDLLDQRLKTIKDHGTIQNPYDDKQEVVRTNNYSQWDPDIAENMLNAQETLQTIYDKQEKLLYEMNDKQKEYDAVMIYKVNKHISQGRYIAFGFLDKYTHQDQVPVCYGNTQIKTVQTTIDNNPITTKIMNLSYVGMDGDLAEKYIKCSSGVHPNIFLINYQGRQEINSDLLIKSMEDIKKSDQYRQINLFLKNKELNLAAEYIDIQMQNENSNNLCKLALQLIEYEQFETLSMQFQDIFHQIYSSEVNLANLLVNHITKKPEDNKVVLSQKDCPNIFAYHTKIETMYEGHANYQAYLHELLSKIDLSEANLGQLEQNISKLDELTRTKMSLLMVINDIIKGIIRTDNKTQLNTLGKASLTKLSKLLLHFILQVRIIEQSKDKTKAAALIALQENIDMANTIEQFQSAISIYNTTTKSYHEAVCEYISGFLEQIQRLFSQDISKSNIDAMKFLDYADRAIREISLKDVDNFKQTLDNRKNLDQKAILDIFAIENAKCLAAVQNGQIDQKLDIKGLLQHTQTLNRIIRIDYATYNHQFARDIQTKAQLYLDLIKQKFELNNRVLSNKDFLCILEKMSDGTFMMKDYEELCGINHETPISSLPLKDNKLLIEYMNKKYQQPNPFDKQVLIKYGTQSKKLELVGYIRVQENVVTLKDIQDWITTIKNNPKHITELFSKLQKQLSQLNKDNQEADDIKEIIEWMEQNIFVDKYFDNFNQKDLLHVWQTLLNLGEEKYIKQIEDILLRNMKKLLKNTSDESVNEISNILSDQHLGKKLLSLLEKSEHQELIALSLATKTNADGSSSLLYPDFNKCIQEIFIQQIPTQEVTNLEIMLKLDELTKEICFDQEDNVYHAQQYMFAKYIMSADKLIKAGKFLDIDKIYESFRGQEGSQLFIMIEKFLIRRASQNIEHFMTSICDLLFKNFDQKRVMRALTCYLEAYFKECPNQKQYSEQAVRKALGHVKQYYSLQSNSGGEVQSFKGSFVDQSQSFKGSFVDQSVSQSQSSIDQLTKSPNSDSKKSPEDKPEDKLLRNMQTYYKKYSTFMENNGLSDVIPGKISGENSEVLNQKLFREYQTNNDKLKAYEEYSTIELAFPNELKGKEMTKCFHIDDMQKINNAINQAVNGSQQIDKVTYYYNWQEKKIKYCIDFHVGEQKLKHEASLPGDKIIEEIGLLVKHYVDYVHFLNKMNDRFIIDSIKSGDDIHVLFIPRHQSINDSGVVVSFALDYKELSNIVLLNHKKDLETIINNILTNKKSTVYINGQLAKEKANLPDGNLILYVKENLVYKYDTKDHKYTPYTTEQYNDDYNPSFKQILGNYNTTKKDNHKINQSINLDLNGSNYKQHFDCLGAEIDKIATDQSKGDGYYIINVKGWKNYEKDIPVEKMPNQTTTKMLKIRPEFQLLFKKVGGKIVSSPVVEAMRQKLPKLQEHINQEDYLPHCIALPYIDYLDIEFLELMREFSFHRILCHFKNSEQQGIILSGDFLQKMARNRFYSPNDLNKVHQESCEVLKDKTQIEEIINTLSLSNELKKRIIDILVCHLQRKYISRRGVIQSSYVLRSDLNKLTFMPELIRNLADINLEKLNILTELKNAFERKSSTLKQKASAVLTELQLAFNIAQSSELAAKYGLSKVEKIANIEEINQKMLACQASAHHLQQLNKNNLQDQQQPESSQESMKNQIINLLQRIYVEEGSNQYSKEVLSTDSSSKGSFSSQEDDDKLQHNKQEELVQIDLDKTMHTGGVDLEGLIQKLKEWYYSQVNDQKQDTNHLKLEAEAILKKHEEIQSYVNNLDELEA